MALPTNTHTTFTSIGQREDLSDVIYDISPMDFPFMSNIDKVSATATYHEWQTDSLRDAAANIALEGDDATGATMTPTTRLGNHCQILQETVVVSGTQRTVNTAGRADDYSYQVARSGKQLKRDLERALTQNQGSSAGGIGTGRSLASLESWLATNKAVQGGASVAGATTPGFAAPFVGPTDASTVGTFTKANLDAVIQSCWTNGGEPDTIMVGPYNRTKVSGFSGISTLETRADQGMDITLIGAVDMYKSNFGVLKVVPNRFQRDRTAFVLDMEYFALAELRSMQVNPLGKTGDSDKAQLVCEVTLVSRNEAASGKITDLATS
jgi:hypothetical protein